MAASLYEQRDKVLALIDRGEWKHSWHVPKYEDGRINWWSNELRQKVIEEKEAAIRHAHALLGLALSIEIPNGEED